MLQMKCTVRQFMSAAFVAAILLLPGRSAFADTLDYMFSGVATGAIVGPTVFSTHNFSNQSFSISFIEDSSTVTGSGGYYSINPVSGTFTEGSYSATLANAFIQVNGNPYTGSGNYETINLFDSTAATDMQIISDPALLNYALGTALAETGSSTGQTIANYPGVGYSLSNGDSLDVSSLSSLNFTVTDLSSPSPVPEPSTLVLLAVGLAGVVVLRRRFSLKDGLDGQPRLC